MEGSEPRQTRLERLVSVLGTWLDALRHVPRILSAVLWASVVAGLGLAWFWFLRHESPLLKMLALPWLAMAAVPQFGLWLLASSLRDLFELPGRLLELKKGIAAQGELVFRGRLDTLESVERPRGGFLRRLRDAYALHGELSQIVATRAILHRFTGRIAILIGPVAFLLNCGIIAIALLQLLIVLA